MRKRGKFAKGTAMAVLGCMLAGTVLSGGSVRTVHAQEPEAAEWDEIQSVISRYYGEWNDTSYPGVFSNQLPNTALLGNGDVGVTSGGDDVSKSFYISKGDFWTYGTGDYSSPCPPLPIGGVTIGKGSAADEETETGNNIAPTYESVTASSYHDEFTPDKAVNGNMQQLPTGYGWVSKRPQDAEEDGNTEFWIQLKFKDTVDFARYVVKNDGAVRSGMEENNTQDFKLQISSDGESWTDVDSVTGNRDSIYDTNLEVPVSAMYVRLLITKANQGTTADSVQNPRARIGQLELYTEPKSSTNEQADPISESEETVLETEKTAVQFHEKQDILNAEIQTTQELADVPTEMKTWISADKNIMVTELQSNGEEDARFQVDTWASTANREIRPVTVENDASSVTVTRSTQNKAPDNPKSHTSKAALSTKIVGTDEVEVSSDDANGKGSFKFTLKGGQKIYIVTAVGGGGRTYTNTGALWEGATEPVEDAVNLLATIENENDVDSLNQARKEWWKDFWSASYVDLGADDENLNKVQKYYYGAQYILGSTAKEGKLAPGLYGIWHTTDNASWSSDYHLNYNFISAFYGTNSSNRPEISLPGVQALLDYVPEGQRRASSIDEIRRINADFVNKKVEKGDISEENGIPGAILFPVGIGPWGTTTDNVYLSEALDASYNSYLMTQYYDYTLDEGFLEAGAYDYMKQAVTFYEAWLEEEDGKYVLYAGYNEGSWAINPAVELAALKNTLRHLISASEALGKDADRREKWIDIYENLGEQPTTVVDGKKVLALGEKQWIGGQWIDLPSPIPGDGNALPLDAVIPGGVYTYFSSPEDLQMIQDTIDVFSARGAWSQINNFPRIFPEAVKSRYPIDTVVTKLVDVIDRQMAPNLRINDRTHGVEKSGSTETINSMMLISDDGITKVFPNWYEDKDAKFARLRAKGAFTVSAEYDGTAKEAKNVFITSEKGSKMTLVSPWNEGATVRDSSGNVMKTTEGTVPNWEDEKTITFDTTAGETYSVEKGQSPVDPELDYTEIDDVIAKAEAIKQDGYSAESYQVLQDAIKNAKEARKNAATQEELNQKKEELQAAIDGLRGSKSVLETFLERAKQHMENGDVDGLVESVQKLFREAIAEGDAVLAKDNASKEDVLNASVKLMKAIQALEMKAGNKADLGMTLELTAAIDLSKYVEAGQAEYLSAKAGAEAVMANGDVMQPEVDAAWNKLVDTIMNLRMKADKSVLEDLIESVKQIDLGKYTDESVKVLQEALEKANEVMENETLSVDRQAEVDAAVKLLASARDGLTEKTGSGDNQNNGGQNNGGQNSGGQGNGNQNGGSKPVNKTVKTGDAASLLPPILGILLSLGGAITVGAVTVRRKRR